MVEQATNRSRSLSNLARAALLLGRPEAATLARNALELAQGLPPSDSQRRATAAAAYALAMVCLVQGPPDAMGKLLNLAETSWAAAGDVDNARQARAVRQSLTDSNQASGPGQPPA